MSQQQRASCGCSVAQSCPILCDPVSYSMPDFLILHQLPELAQTHVHESVMPPNHLILCCPFLLLPSIFPNIRVFSINNYFIFFSFLFIYLFLFSFFFFLFVVNFVIHWNETAMGLHVFPIPIPPPTSLSTRSL